MRAFIVRPFNVKQGVDFEAVHRELIEPALQRAGIQGATTQEIARAGNIREDMFRLLATADLVIADITIHNANVFYELGVRHALQAKWTYLIRASVHDVPFDLLTDRYLQYDKDNPGASLSKLAEGLAATLDSDAADSPVYSLLRLNPDLIPRNFARLLEPPDDFREEVNRACREGRVGDLSLLAEDAKRLGWAREGLRDVGDAQFRLGAFESAQVTWEDVREYQRGDVEANTRLATIYQKLNKHTEAEEAVDRVLNDGDVTGPQRVELLSLRGSNYKTQWIQEWERLDSQDARGASALGSPLLERAYDAYLGGFAEDRNHFYSGLNALALTTIRLELSARMPDVWIAAHDTEDDAAAAREKLLVKRNDLLVGVRLALESARAAARFRTRPDPWVDVSDADLALLMPNATPAQIAARYRGALADAQGLNYTAILRQLHLYKKLGVVPKLAEAGIEVVSERAQATRGRTAALMAAPSRVLLFTGHRVDAPGRAKPRFPPASEAKARDMIARAVDQEVALAGGGPVIGLAGGASGGDILFHEVCAERGIKTEVFVVGSRDAFVVESVADGGPNWVRRFDKILETAPSRYLGNSQLALNQPRWLRPAKDYSIWARNNRWILHNALVFGARKVTLVALWNCERGDGPGGTKHMIESAEERGATVVKLDARELV